MAVAYSPIFRSCIGHLCTTWVICAQYRREQLSNDSRTIALLQLFAHVRQIWEFSDFNDIFGALTNGFFTRRRDVLQIHQQNISVQLPLRIPVWNQVCQFVVCW